jgi:hypothetical protein
MNDQCIRCRVSLMFIPSLKSYNKKFCGVQGRFFKRALGRRRQKKGTGKINTLKFFQDIFYFQSSFVPDGIGGEFGNILGYTFCNGNQNVIIGEYAQRLHLGL